jgi:arylsulfatase A-like enzyme
MPGTMAMNASSCLGVLFCLAAACPTLSAADPPHMVVILGDDFGWHDVGYHGSEIKTPAIDRLAASGVRLDQHYVQPVCSPTRAALLTGRYPMRYGMQMGVVLAWQQHGLPVAERTLAQALREAGYTTAITGKWHLGHHQEAHLPTRRGFDYQYGHYLGMIDYYTHTHHQGLDWHRQDRPLREQGYATELIGSQAVRLIEAHDPARPLFLYVAFNAPHTPLQAPPAYLARYEHIADERRRTFAAMMTCMDDQIELIMAALKKRQMAANTLVFFSGDNGGAEYGGADNGPLRGVKGNLYEGGLRTPALAVWPGRIPAGRIVHEPIHITDWYPTLVKLAGGSLEQELPLDGHDMRSVLTQGKPTSRTEILHNVSDYTGALRQGRWKLVVNGNHRRSLEEDRSAPIVELFDIAADPYERTNLAGLHPEVLEQMQRRLEEYRRQSVPSQRPPSNRRPDGWTAPRVWGPHGATLEASNAPG